MATAAQIAANRLNAQKSTGPRTAEGKAVVSQNAITHGLLAREGVIRGEDAEEFEMHLERLMKQLSPVQPLEEILATRIVDLTWRLKRAVQDQKEAFAALYDRHTGAATEPQEPDERGGTLGRLLVDDFSGAAVLERLLRYERRIENSLYRSLNELRRVHDQCQKADQEVVQTLDRWREEDLDARKTRAFACWRPADPPEEVSSVKGEVSSGRNRPSSPPTSDFPRQTGLPVQTGDMPSCQTNPISEGVSSWKCQVSSTQSQLASPSSPPTSNFARQTTAESCETNPIWHDPKGGQVFGGTGFRNDSGPSGLEETNPMCAGTSGPRTMPMNSS